MALPIETERLRLRRYEDRDLADILAYSTDADYWLARNLDWPATEEGVRDYWEAQRAIDPRADPEWFSLVVELKAEGKAIGQVGLGVIKTGEYRQGTVGWLLGRKYQGQGLATEAARALVTYGFDEFDEFASLVDPDGIFWGLGVEDGWGMMDKDWMTKGVLFLGLEVGDRVWIRAYEADGTCYRMIPSR